MSLWQHQNDDIQIHGLDAAHALFWEPRTGKSRTMRGHIERLHAEKDVRRTLIVAPQLPLRTTWTTELLTLRDVRVHDLTEGEVPQRAARLRDLALFRATGAAAMHDIVLVNYDVLYKLRASIIKWRPQLVIADEAHLCKSPGARRAAALQRIGDYALYRRALTGTPDPRSYEDYYAIYRFLDAEIFGTSATDFRDRYCNMHPIYRNNVASYKKDMLPELRQKVFSIASRKLREDCFDMPKIHEIERTVEMPQKAWDVYEKIVEDHTYSSDWLELDAEHKIARLGILQRITSGFAYLQLENGNLNGKAAKWVHDAKINAAVEELSDIVLSGNLAVVFYLYRAEGNALVEALSKAFGSEKVVKLDGETPTDERVRMTAGFDPARTSMNDKVQILVVQEQVGSLGISFARAKYALFYSYSMNYAAHSQAADRIWSPGTSTTLTKTYLTVPSSVDIFIRKLVSHKDASSRMLLDVGFKQAARGKFS